MGHVEGHESKSSEDGLKEFRRVCSEKTQWLVVGLNLRTVERRRGIRYVLFGPKRQKLEEGPFVEAMLGLDVSTTLLGRFFSYWESERSGFPSFLSLQAKTG